MILIQLQNEDVQKILFNLLTSEGTGKMLKWSKGHLEICIHTGNLLHCCIRYKAG